MNTAHPATARSETRIPQRPIVWYTLTGLSPKHQAVVLTLLALSAGVMIFSAVMALTC